MGTYGILMPKNVSRIYGVAYVSIRLAIKRRDTAINNSNGANVSNLVRLSLSFFFMTYLQKSIPILVPTDAARNNAGSSMMPCGIIAASPAKIDASGFIDTSTNTIPKTKPLTKTIIPGTTTSNPSATESSATSKFLIKIASTVSTV